MSIGKKMGILKSKQNRLKGVLLVMNVLKKTIRIMDIAVFVFTTIAIGGVFYEGMTLRWYDVVGIFIICMDYSFMPTTILHLITDRKEKWYPLHIFSMILIVIAIVMKIASIEYPAITLLLWYFYLWFLYGCILVGRYLVKK